MKRLVGQIIKEIRGLKQYSDEVFIETESGITFKFHHYQDCCEQVQLEDFEMDSDLVGALVVSAEEVIGEASESDEHGTWTFYKIETNRGGLFMRWLGESNGYYSESVDLDVY
jgi:hypothetical protein